MHLPPGAPSQQQPAAAQWQQPAAAQKRARPLPRLAAAATSTAERPAASAPATPDQGPVVLKRTKVMHSLTQERLELFRSLDSFAEEQVLPLLKPPTKCWQPSDFLPSPESSDFMDQVRELRVHAAELPPDYFVVLVGDMITEEALPTYMAMLNTLDGVRDESGSDPGPWARWTRQWVAEENRHGDLLNKYCYLTGRVDMRAVEVTIQNLIGSGMDPQTENNPYHCFIYTSFQERATKVSHGNTGRQALQHGDAALAKLCGIIAADESRHEVAYTRIVDELFRLDPSGATLAFADMMRKQIVMPAHWMDDAQHGTSNAGRNLFTDYSLVAERLGVYDAHDYLDIMTHLIARWDVNGRTGLSPEAEQAQDYLMQLPRRLERLAERAASRKHKSGNAKEAALARFSWVFNEEVAL